VPRAVVANEGCPEMHGLGGGGHTQQHRVADRLDLFAPVIADQLPHGLRERRGRVRGMFVAVRLGERRIASQIREDKRSCVNRRSLAETSASAPSCWSVVPGRASRFPPLVSLLSGSSAIASDRTGDRQRATR